MDKWLSNPTASKIISLVLAILLWVIVHVDDETPANVAAMIDTKVIDSVQIKTEGLDTSRYRIKSMDAEVVRLQVKGQNSALVAALPEDYSVTADLTGFGEGTHTVKLNYDLPRGVQLVSLLPSAVTVSLEEIQTKEMDITILTTGTPAKGYKAGQPIIQPSNRAHVTLPESQLKDVHAIRASINVEGQNHSVKQKRVKLTAYDAKGNEMTDATITPAVVEVEIPITKPFKTVPLQINYTGKLPDGLSISSVVPSSSQVILYGSQEILDSMEFYDSVQIDLNGIQETTTLDITLPIPNGVEKVEPSSVKFVITVVPAVQRLLENIPITLSGETDQLKATLTNPASKTMSLMIEGSPDIVNLMDSSNVQLIASVNDLPPGTHQVELQANLPNFVRRADATPIYVTVTVEDTSAPTAADPAEQPELGQDNSNSSSTPSNQPEVKTEAVEEDNGA